MKHNFERSIALRYLRGAQGKSEGRKFLRFVTLIAVAGVSLGVCALIIALSIVRGFSHEIESKIVSFGAQIQVENYRDAPIDDAASVRNLLESQKEISSIAPVVEEFVLLRAANGRADGVSLRGMESIPASLEKRLIQGTASLQWESGHGNPVVIGASLAKQLRLDVGDKVHAFSVRRNQAAAGARHSPRLKEFRVTGIYETSLADFDDTYVFAPIDIVRDLLRYRDDQVTRFDLSLGTGEDARSIALKIDRELTFPLMARSIYEVYRSLFAWVNLQQSIIPLIIGIIVLVAAFNIIGTLLMIILEKTREIGVFASIGASRVMLRRIFLYLGLYIGAAGICIGELIAVVFSWVQLRYSVIPLPKEAYYMSTAPIDMSIFDFLIIALITIILCALSSYLPARFAAKIEPVRAIHLR